MVAPELVTKAEYARRHGVSKPAVGKWEKRGWLVMVDGQVDVEKSNANLEQYRDASDGRSKRGGERKPTAVNLAAVNSVHFDSADETLEQAAELIKSLGADMTTDEARRVKENYLALSGKLEYEQKAGQLIDLAAARGVMFDEFRRVRDAWQNWPAKYAALIAADLGIEADRVTEVLAGYVHKQIAALGEPQGQFGEG